MTPLQASREESFRSMGALADELLTRLVPPMRRNSDGRFMPGCWPVSATGALRIIRRATSVVVATDGLSDPWDADLHSGAPSTGLGYEVAVEVSSQLALAVDNQAVAESWAPRLLWCLADWLVAERFDMQARLKHFGLLSLALPATVRGLTSLAGSNGYVGVLIGISAVGNLAGSSLVIAEDPAGPIWLVTAKLLCADEYDWILGVPDASRAQRLADCFVASGAGSLSSPARPSVLPGLSSDYTASR